MSAIVSVVTSGGVYLYTDAAACGWDGRLASIGCKVQILPHWSAGIAHRGSPHFPHLLAMHWPGEALSFDEAMTNLMGACDHALSLMREAHYPAAAEGGSDFELVIAGWSEEEEAFQVWEVSGAMASVGLPPKMRKLSGLVAAWPVPEGDRVAAIWPQDHDPEPGEIASLLMNEIRSNRYPHMMEPATLYHAVGGFIQETFLSREACVTQIMERWPDVIGEQIQPTGMGEARCT